MLLKEQLLPYDTNPTTARVCVLRYGTKPRMQILKQSGIENIELPANAKLADYRKYIDLKDEDPKERKGKKTTDIVKLYWNNPLLKCGLVFVDCPGFDEANVDHLRATQNQITNADVCLLFIDAATGVTSQDLDALNFIRTKCDMTRVLVVLNKVDTITADLNNWQSGENTSDEKAQQRKLTVLRQEFAYNGIVDQEAIIAISQKNVHLARRNRNTLPQEFQMLCERLFHFARINWDQTITELLQDFQMAFNIILDKALPEQAGEIKTTEEQAVEMWASIKRDIQNLSTLFASKIQAILQEKGPSIVEEFTKFVLSPEASSIPAKERNHKLVDRLRVTVQTVLKESLKGDMNSSLLSIAKTISDTDKQVSDARNEIFKLSLMALLPKGEGSKNFTFRRIFYPSTMPVLKIPTAGMNNSAGWINDAVIGTGSLTIGRASGKLASHKMPDLESGAVNRTWAQNFAQKYIQSTEIQMEFAEEFIRILMDYAQEQEQKFFARFRQMKLLVPVLPTLTSELPVQIAHLQMQVLSIQFRRSGQIVDDVNKMVLIGEGGQGAVYKATINGQEVAVKKFHVSVNGEVVNCPPFYEAHILRTLSDDPRTQKYVVKFVSCWIEGDYFYLATELMDSDLRSQLKHLPLEKRLNIGLQIAIAMEAIHEVNIAHRDLKADNILVKFNPWEIKLGDTGESKEAKLFTVPRRPVGTPGFIAPEYFTRDSDTPVDGMKADVFSFGILMWQLLTMKKVKDRKLDSDRPAVPNLPQHKEYISLMQQCWAADPNSRPTFKMIHWFFKRYAKV